MYETREDLRCKRCKRIAINLIPLNENRTGRKICWRCNKEILKKKS